MEVVYEDNHIKNRKSLILRYFTDNQPLAIFTKKQKFLQIYCRIVVGSQNTSRFIVGENMVVS